MKKVNLVVCSSVRVTLATAYYMCTVAGDVCVKFSTEKKNIFAVKLSLFLQHLVQVMVAQIYREGHSQSAQGSIFLSYTPRQHPTFKLDLNQLTILRLSITSLTLHSPVQASLRTPSPDALKGLQHPGEPIYPAVVAEYVQEQHWLPGSVTSTKPILLPLHSVSLQQLLQLL